MDVDDGYVFVKLKENGELESTSFIETSITRNGVKQKSTFSSSTFTGSWGLANGKFMWANVTPYEITEENGVLRLTRGDTSYIKVGDLTFDITAAVEGADTDSTANNTVPYSLNKQLSAEGVELVFTEGGIAKSCRVTTKRNGIKITAGPDEIDGKKYVYLKGTIKNTSKSDTFAVIAGNVSLDGYEYDISISLIDSGGSPTSRIDPLETMTIILYAAVPEKLADTFEDGVLTFGFNDNFKDVELSKAQYLYTYRVSH